MSRIALSGDASGTGTFTIASPNSNSNFTLTLPQANTTVVGTDATQTLTNKTLTSPTITGASMSSMASSVITSGTAVASTSGTSIDFTGIPSWVRRVTLMFDSVSTNGAANPFLIQIGPSGGVETSGYVGGSGAIFGSNSCQGTNGTTGFAVMVDNSAANVVSGALTISLLNASTNTWAASGTFCQSNRTLACLLGYTKPLAGVLSRVRVTTTGGTDAFDAGTINILYE